MWKHEGLVVRVGHDIYPAAFDVENLGEALDDVLDEIERAQGEALDDVFVEIERGEDGTCWQPFHRAQEGVRAWVESRRI